MFYRVNNDDTADLFHDCGDRVTRIDTDYRTTAYPIGSDLSVEYEHPEGITVEVCDAKNMGLVEDA